jgi:hypothetical protein
MTALTTAHPGKTGAVVRTYFANRMTLIGMPMIILAGILVVNIIVWALILTNVGAADRADVREGLQWSGASIWIFGYMSVVAIQGVSIVLPFALSYGATRRQFSTGSGLAFLLVAIFYTVVLTVLALIEEATSGWWVGGRMFTAIYFAGGTWYERALVYFAIMVFSLAVGGFFASVYARWRRTGVLLTSAVVVLGVIGALFVIGEWIGWTPFFTEVEDLTTALGWVWLPIASLVPSLVLAGAAYLVLRRVTPAH